MAFEYRMRGYYAAGETYVYWTSDTYDLTGSDYSGVPAFGALTNIHAASKVFVDTSGSGGGSVGPSPIEASGMATDQSGDAWPCGPTAMATAAPVSTGLSAVTTAAVPNTLVTIG